MYEYIAKFGDMAGHAYSIKPTDSISIILDFNFIEGVQNPHVKNKVRSYQVKNLKDIFGHVIHEDQKQKIRALDFGVSSKPDPILNCNINAIKDKACFECGSEGHFIKDCHLSQPDNMAQKSKYSDHRMDNNSSSTTDMVMEPLTRIFADLMAQLKLLTPSGHSPHNGPPIMKGMADTVTSRWASTMAIGNMVAATTIGRIMSRRTAALIITIRPVSNGMDIIGTVGML